MGQFDMCCVRHCKKRRDIDQDVSFFSLPRGPEDRRRAWVKFTGRTTQPKKSWKVCSSHFVNGRSWRSMKTIQEGDVDYVPTLNPPQATHTDTPKTDGKQEDGAVPNSDDSENATCQSTAKTSTNDRVPPTIATEGQQVEADRDSDGEDFIRRKKLNHPKSTVCAECGKDFKFYSRLKQHRRSHTQKYACEKCDEKFTALQTLQKHYKKSHDVTVVEKRYMCDFCGHQFTSSSGLADHRRLHTGDKPFVCTECGKTFPRKTDLKIHVISVHSPKPGATHFECLECGKMFITKSRLKLHMTTHLDEVHQCPHCDKTFSHKSRLDYHILGIHSNNRDFQCKVCSRKFGSKFNLKTHSRIHSGEKPYTCCGCNKQFSDVCNYRRHEKKCSKMVVTSTNEIWESGENYDQTTVIKSETLPTTVSPGLLNGQVNQTSQAISADYIKIEIINEVF